MAISSERKNAILAAINELHDDTGQVPTVAGVIEKMGGGSASYVTPILRGWREAQSERERMIRAMPASVKKAMAEAGAALWAIATQEADAELNRYRQISELEAQQLIQERNLALTDLEKMEANLDRVVTHNSELEQANVVLHDQGFKLQAELDVKTVEIEKLQERLDDHIALLADQRKSSAALERRLLEIAGKASK